MTTFNFEKENRFLNNFQPENKNSNKQIFPLIKKKLKISQNNNSNLFPTEISVKKSNKFQNYFPVNFNTKQIDNNHSLSSLSDHCEFDFYLLQERRLIKTFKKTFFQNDILSTIPLKSSKEFKKTSFKFKTKSLSNIPLNTSSNFNKTFKSYFKNNYIYIPENIIRLESKYRITKKQILNTIQSTNKKILLK